MRYTFRCPACAKLFTHDESGEPLCTGPSETRDEHAPILMRLVKVDRRELHPAVGAARAAGPLILAAR